MGKKKISKKQGPLLKDMPEGVFNNESELRVFPVFEDIRDKKIIAAALWDCLLVNDTMAFKEILRTHLELVHGKDEFAKSAGLSRRTLFRMLSDEGNPTLENISKIISKICA